MKLIDRLRKIADSGEAMMAVGITLIIVSLALIARTFR